LRDWVSLNQQASELLTIGLLDWRAVSLACRSSKAQGQQTRDLPMAGTKEKEKKIIF